MSAATVNGAVTLEALTSYLRTTVGEGTEAERNGRLAWRLYCAEQGAEYADELESAGVRLAGRDVLDVGTSS